MNLLHFSFEVFMNHGIVFSSNLEHLHEVAISSVLSSLNGRPGISKN